MELKALITLDLDNVSNKQRADFYNYLEDANLVKISNIDTAWKCTFSEDVNRTNAIVTCKDIIKNAAKSAGISSITSAIQIGSGDVVEF